MDIKEFLLGEEEWSFLLQVPVRVAIMFSIALAALRLAGKRAVPQGIFELLLIVILGSAAGDPVIYQKVGVLPAIIVFALVVIVYKIFHRITLTSKKAEQFIEGRHECLIQEGRFNIAEISRDELEKDELFADLRQQNVSQLGQVRRAYIEASGKISLFFFNDADVVKGLPIFPESLCAAKEAVAEAGEYACTYCGNVQPLPSTGSSSCNCCGKKRWVPASAERRVT